MNYGSSYNNKQLSKQTSKKPRNSKIQKENGQSIAAPQQTWKSVYGSDHNKAEFSLNQVQQQPQPQQKQIRAYADHFVSNEVFILRRIIWFSSDKFEFASFFTDSFNDQGMVAACPYKYSENDKL